MADRTVATHVDPELFRALESLIHTENRAPSEAISVALRSFLDYSPNARRALFAIDEIADGRERAFAAKLIGRSVLRAYEAILEGRAEQATRPR